MTTLAGKGLHLSYQTAENRILAVRDATVLIKSGRLTFLCGGRRSGKTSLLYMLGCLLWPDGGEVLVNGIRVGLLPIAERAIFRRRHIGFVFQTLRLFETLTVLQNITVSLNISENGNSFPDVGMAALRRVGLEGKWNVMAMELSVGERRRLAIARAVVRDPAILLADEPAGQLNDPSDGDIAGLLASFARSDRIVTVASRDTRWTYYAQQCVRIENGCVASEERNI